MSEPRRARGWTYELIETHPNATEVELDALAALNRPKAAHSPASAANPKHISREQAPSPSPHTDDILSITTIVVLRSGQVRVTSAPAAHNT